MAVLSDARGELDDAALVAASLDEPEVFGELFRRHPPRLHAYARRRLGPVLADDVVSEAFATAFRRRARFDGRAEFGAWLWGIASNQIAKHHRRETRMYRAFARTGTDPAEEGVADRASDRASAAACGPDLARALASLGAQDRNMLPSSGNSMTRALQICSGDHRSRGLSATNSRSGPSWVSLASLGRARLLAHALWARCGR